MKFTQEQDLVIYLENIGNFIRGRKTEMYLHQDRNGATGLLESLEGLGEGCANKFYGGCHFVGLQIERIRGRFGI